MIGGARQHSPSRRCRQEWRAPRWLCCVPGRCAPDDLDIDPRDEEEHRQCQTQPATADERY